MCRVVFGSCYFSVLQSAQARSELRVEVGIGPINNLSCCAWVKLFFRASVGPLGTVRLDNYLWLGPHIASFVILIY